MKKVVGFSKWLAVIIVLGFGPWAFGQTANITLTSPGSNVMNGVYVGPYFATVNGVSTPIICDDFADETYNNESWTANVHTTSNLSGTKWGTGASALYNEAAHFAGVMMGLESNPSANAQTIGYLSYTIWALFDQSAVEAWLGSGSTAWKAVEGYLGTAGGYASVAAPSNMVLLTPNTNDPITCGGGACATAPPQEFIAFVPEGGSPLLYLVFAGLACGAAMFHRSRPLGVKGSA